MVWDGHDEWLLCGLCAAQTMETDLVFGIIDLDSDETVGPERVDEVAMQEDLNNSVFVGTTQKDNRSR
jgi:hypothetical protein